MCVFLQAIIRIWKPDCFCCSHLVFSECCPPTGTPCPQAGMVSGYRLYEMSVMVVLATLGLVRKSVEFFVFIIGEFLKLIVMI